ncbi:RimJ/RimL family protein N-acetyltransferase [Arcicella aurantiaca]|uniref:RimJ/RimL family protein N-acetyltransferase n=1 Tax=Arcicella aurantiaca TaxID=591202 RepID=A0A316EB04_9BACT|nr:GNAT family N-acetyltransferase [Arcicella aurantiaca]PWK27981.1 RimJ/RimL family protein N-acetyltransferase [Arcicella aurantiaca]
MEIVIETERLILRKFTIEDASFVLELVNTPAWLQFIGDRNVHTVEEAENYLLNGNIKSYADYGFGFYLVATKESNEAIGMCGIVKRDSLDDIDIGFAFLPNSIGKGYGYEAASATLDYGLNVLKLGRIVAIVDPENANSIALIKKIGLKYEKMVQISTNDIELMLFGN